MGQVLGFSHCQEYGSVASTPDSTPPCTDGGNEESELCELQTAREWSDDDDGADGDDEDGLASSPSLWGTPRQHSYELTFSYFAIAEPEAVGASRHLRERRRGGSRSSRTALFRTDTLETLLDSPDVEWDHQAFLTQEGQEAAAERSEQTWPSTAHTEWTDFEGENYGQLSATPLPQCQEPQERDTGFQRDETPHSFTVQTSTPSQSSSHTLQSTSLSPEPASPVSRETISVKLLTSVPPRGALPGDLTSSSVAATGLNTQEQLVSEHWFSALNLAEADTVWTHIWTHIAAVDLIYWKDTERSGMVLTGIVVGLLSLFQLSIISVLATVSLAVMCFTISVRLYYQVLYILNWGDGVHPFKSYLDLNISLSGELADRYMQKAIVTVLSVVDALKRLFFVGNLFNSLKILVVSTLTWPVCNTQQSEQRPWNLTQGCPMSGQYAPCPLCDSGFLFLLYLVTFVGKLFNGLTLLIIGVIALFSLPLFYQRHQVQVDSVVGKIQGHYDNITDILLRLAHGGSPPPDQTPGGAKPNAH